jgi:hypothetical protein
MAPGQTCVMKDEGHHREVCDSSFTFSVSGRSAIQNSGLTHRVCSTAYTKTEGLDTSVTYITFTRYTTFEPWSRAGHPYKICRYPQSSWARTRMHHCPAPIHIFIAIIHRHSTTSDPTLHSVFLPFLVLPLLHTHCRCRVIVAPDHTHWHTHTNSSGRVISPQHRPLHSSTTQHSQQIDIHAPAGLEPKIPASEQSQIHASECTATDIKDT